VIIRRLKDIKSIMALDNSIIRELLNPNHDEEELHLNYSLAHATVKPGDSTLPHRFHEASEVYYILHGRGLMHINDETQEVQHGDMIYIPPQAVQYIENIGDINLEFLCIVDPPWYPEAEETV
jgi:mannose-6-phosphate isomerase-like protein (cupin superfamily)